MVREYQTYVHIWLSKVTPSLNTYLKHIPSLIFQDKSTLAGNRIYFLDDSK